MVATRRPARGPVPLWLLAAPLLAAAARAAVPASYFEATKDLSKEGREVLEQIVESSRFFKKMIPCPPWTHTMLKQVQEALEAFEDDLASGLASKDKQSATVDVSRIEQMLDTLASKRNEYKELLSKNGLGPRARKGLQTKFLEVFDAASSLRRAVGGLPESGTIERDPVSTKAKPRQKAPHTLMTSKTVLRVEGGGQRRGPSAVLDSATERGASITRTMDEDERRAEQRVRRAEKLRVRRAEQLLGVARHAWALAEKAVAKDQVLQTWLADRSKEFYDIAGYCREFYTQGLHAIESVKPDGVDAVLQTLKKIAQDLDVLEGLDVEYSDLKKCAAGAENPLGRALYAVKEAWTFMNATA